MARIHDVGSGAAIPAKITGDGWIVEQDVLPVPIACLGQSTAEIILPAHSYNRAATGMSDSYPGMHYQNRAEKEKREINQ